MGKSLLSLVLVVTQVVPCTASPLFLCVGSDGSVCLDGGPAACSCCRDHDDDACCGDASHSERHNQFLPGDLTCEWASSDDCDCAHVLLSLDARVVRRMRADDDLQTIAPSLVTSFNTAGMTIPATAPVTFSGLIRSGTLSLPLGERAPLVLRC